MTSPVVPAHPARGTVAAPTRQDGALTVSVLCVFAAAWFSWTPDASGALAIAVRIGAIAAVVLAVLGGVQAVRLRGTSEILGHRSISRRYALVVGLELAAAGVGAVILVASGGGRFVPVWFCAVVGAHFLPLATVLGTPHLRWLGVALVAVSAVGLLAGLLGGIEPSTVTGTGAGTALLAYAVLVLVRLPPPPAAAAEQGRARR